MVGASAESLNDNEAFSAAVKAVKARDYSRALILFEQQANDAKHDAQYNMAVLSQAGKGRPRNYPDALYWSWLAQLGGIEEMEVDIRRRQKRVSTIQSDRQTFGSTGTCSASARNRFASVTSSCCTSGVSSDVV